MTKFVFAVAFLLIGITGSWLTPWSRPRAMITVTGEAKQQISNQVARYNVSVTQTNKDKQTAVDAVNQAMTTITAGVKEFGIENKDLTTQNVSVYETETEEAEILIYPPRPGTGEKQWQANNSLAIILRDPGRATELTDLLQGFDLAQVSGPSFTVNDTGAAETDLLTEAVADAKAKAEKAAQASGRRLGKVLTVSEGGSSQPYPLMYRSAAEDMAVSSAPVEPGSTRLTKTVTVVFELK